MAGRYSDALKVMERRTPENYSRGAWVQRAASFVVLGREAEARATRDETLPRPQHRKPFGQSSPQRHRTGHLIRTMKHAGFPLCSRVQVKPNARRLPECVSG